MPIYSDGLEYDAALDVLSHAATGASAGVYYNPQRLQVDNFGHVVDIETGNVGAGYIDGLGFYDTGEHEITVEPGAAFIPGLNRVVELAEETTVAIPATTPGGQPAYYDTFNLYLREVNGVGTVVADKTAVSDPYFAAGRTMLGDTFSRYIGQVKNDQQPEVIQIHAVSMGSALRVIHGTIHEGQSTLAMDAVTVATTVASQSIGPSAPAEYERIVPKSCRAADLYMERAGSGAIHLGWPIDRLWNRPPVTFPSADPYMYAGLCLLGPDQEVYYKSTSGAPDLFLYVLGYIDRR